MKRSLRETNMEMDCSDTLILIKELLVENLYEIVERLRHSPTGHMLGKEEYELLLKEFGVDGEVDMQELEWAIFK